MIFRTEQPIPKYPFSIGYEDHLFFIGSCFSDHIGRFFKDHQFPTVSNPFGTLFNPSSIAQNLSHAIVLDTFPKEYLYFHNNQYISFLHQSKFCSDTENGLSEMIQQEYQESHNFLLKTNFLFITLGTSTVYRFKEREIIVANCHKIPNERFEKFRLTITEVVSDYKDLLSKIFEINSNIKVIFTVSPVRHLSDGFHENQLSKSILHLAIDQLVDDTRVFYFPSYELLIDDLRDYRFYAQDLCHPGSNGITYIEEYLKKSFFKPETELQLKVVEKELKRKNHRTIK